MGGDFAPEAIVLGAIEARKEIPSEHSITLVRDTEIAKNIFRNQCFRTTKTSKNKL